MSSSAVAPGVSGRRRIGGRLLFILRALFTVCLLATVIFIFANSAEIGELSGGKSAAVTALLNRGMEKAGFGFRFSEGLVRKLAHFAEYALLGFWLILTLRVYTRRVLSFLSWPLFLGLATAVTDELFQTMVPGRSGQVRDVAIDFGGIAGGTMAGLFAILLAGAVWDAFHGKR